MAMTHELGDKTQDRQGISQKSGPSLLTTSLFRSLLDKQCHTFEGRNRAPDLPRVVYCLACSSELII
jgi:hypothetical protein